MHVVLGSRAVVGIPSRVSGHTYTQADFDRVVANAENKLKTSTIVISLGKASNQLQDAVGVIKNVWVEGGRLFAKVQLLAHDKGRSLGIAAMRTGTRFHLIFDVWMRISETDQQTFVHEAAAWGMVEDLESRKEDV